LTRANTEIDLCVDEIKNRADANKPASKELEQKFGILLSARQAETDFELCVRELAPLNRSVAVLFVDIDNFKLLNTRYTEAVIDKTILPQAMRLVKELACLRGNAYRYGGEEFLVILPNVDELEATSIAEKLRGEFKSTSFKVHEEVNNLTVSIGVALWPYHGSTYDDVLERANQAEKKAKGQKNTWLVANSDVKD